MLCSKLDNQKGFNLNPFSYKIGGFRCSPSPHGGLRPNHQKSSCLTQLTFCPYVVQIWSRSTPESWRNETLQKSFHARFLEGVAKSQSPLKAQVFKSQPSSIWTPFVKRTASWNLAWFKRLFGDVASVASPNATPLHPQHQTVTRLRVIQPRGHYHDGP